MLVAQIIQENTIVDVQHAAHVFNVRHMGKIMLVSEAHRCAIFRDCKDLSKLQSAQKLTRLADIGFASLGVHEKGDNETVETQNFGENEDQNHSNEQPGLLCGTTDTSISDNTDSETSSHTG